ncbi:hypothetical protein SNE40_013883 [Patella caerulea]|uniref:PDZ domain-containing protein n=1 Tax=Patella caerulea TaxID=87958 RepID=A0AAN8JH45_PATCE
MAGEVAECQLRRHDTSQPWGFRMQGGAEYGMPLFMAQVSSKSIGGKAGLKEGDALLAIGRTPVQGWTHERAKAEMIRAGNEMDLTVQRGVVNTKDPNFQAAQAQMKQANPSRSELDEESINPHMNEGTKFRNVKPKTYQILEKEFCGEPEASTAAPAAAAAADAPRPASIFNKKKQERSNYLKAAGPTIQKAFGQS